MFDKLIETEPEGTSFRNRRRYFMTSSIIVGILFVTAVVISIYASDYGLGSENFEMAMVIAPPDIPPVAPEPPSPQHSVNTSESHAVVPQRPEYVAPVSDSREPPTGTASVPNMVPEWSPTHGPLHGTDGDGRIGDGTGTPGSLGDGMPAEPAAKPDRETPPPPVHKPVEEKPTIIRSPGPVNGKATYLPKPPYPAAAIALKLETKVDVQVTIDETGKVTSAKAVSGNGLFRAPAERAAWQAKFSPTYLGKVPVKVTGVIVYNFVR